jgi:hypothetical protein
MAEGQVIPLLLLVVLLVFPRAAAGQTDDDLFEVLDVRVDVTDTTAEAARTRALADGERKAFQVLVDRLTVSTDKDKASLANLEPARISALITDFWVSEEKTSAVRYIATLNYSFDSARVRSLFVSRKVSFASTRSPPVLVVPILESGATFLLWEPENRWWQAWTRLRRDGLVPVMLPPGDIIDRLQTAPDRLAQGSPEDAALLNRRSPDQPAYVVVAQTVPQDPAVPEGPREVKVTTHRFDPGGASPQTNLVAFRGEADTTENALLAKAAAGTLLAMEDIWKTTTRVQTKVRGVIAVNVPVASLPDWLNMRRRLRGVAAIEKIDLVLMSRSLVRVNLFFLGTADDLVVTLKQQGLDLAQGEEAWTLKPVVAQTGSQAVVPP